MLNELHSLAKGMRDAGFELMVKHDDIKMPGKNSPTLRLLLSSSGTLDSVAIVDKDNLDNCWSVADSKKNQFPAVKLVYPLRPGGHAAYQAWKAEHKKPNAEQYLQMLTELRDQTELDLGAQSSWPEDAKYRQRIQQRGENLTPSVPVVEALFTRFLAIGNNGLDLLHQLDETLWQRCQSLADSDMLKIAATAFFGEKLKNGKEGDKRITLLIDTRLENSEFLATDRRWVPELSAALFNAAKQDTQTSKKSIKTGVCAITAEECLLIDSNFPSEKLPVIGNTILYSRYDGGGNKAVRRYNQSKADSYSASVEATQDMAAALSHITSTQLKHKTWRTLTAESKHTDLLIAYCPAAAELALIPAVAGQYNDEIGDEDDYIMVTEEVIDGFQGKSIDDDEPVNFIVLRTISKGVHKIVFSSSNSIQELKAATESWKKASDNLPDIKLPRYLKTKKKVDISKIHSIAPLAFLKIMKRYYNVSGGNDGKVAGSTISMAMRLFLGSDRAKTQAAQHFLPKIYNQYSYLIEKITVRKRLPSHVKYEGYQIRIQDYQDAARAIMALGITLYQLGNKKKDYMDSLAFKLGQLFAAADEMHVGYCMDKRKGDIPPQLIGNKAYSMAIHNPTTALGNLASRFAPYHAWAESVSRLTEEKRQQGLNYLIKKHGKEKGKKIHEERKKLSENGAWAFRSLRKHTPQVLVALKNDCGSNNTEFKAELLLGYLAGRPYEPNEKNGENN